MKRSTVVEGYGIPLGRALAGANRHDSILLEATLDTLDALGPLPDRITVHLDAAYNSAKTREFLDKKNMAGDIAQKGIKAPLQATERWQVERTHSWENAFNRLQRCHEKVETVVNAFFDLADAIITIRSPIRQAWILYRWDTRPAKCP
jgi:hypothetical protein